MNGGTAAGGAPVAIEVLVNGEPLRIAEGATVAAIVGSTGVAPEARGVAVAVDGEVVLRSEWATTVVRSGQRIEVLTAAAGG